MPPRRTITLTSDFGLRDWFVGVLKGVLAGGGPGGRHPARSGAPTVVVDITHEVPSGDIRAGAFAVMAACRYFPHGTIHVAVVDPGVGSARRPIAVKTRDYFFIGPDNGVLSWALRNESAVETRVITNAAWFLKPVSKTFHGRDVFAPVATRLAAGANFSAVGPVIGNILHLPWPEPVGDHGNTRGQVVYVDRFGNAITNLPVTLITRKGSPKFELPGKRHCPVVDHYQSVRKGGLAAIAGSSGFIEIAVNGGSAQIQAGLRIGSRVTLLTSED